MGLVILVLAFRILGPSDLDLKDQPKTVSYTLDIIEHGRWAWPHDMLGDPATKPPFYNWVGAAIVYITGISNEFFLKMPTLLAGAAIFFAMYWFFTRIIADSSFPARTMAALSMLVFVSNVSVFRLIYVARPDMMLTCCLFVAWCCVTGLINDAASSRQYRGALKAALWLSFSVALLTKGPPAMLLPLYIIVVGVYRRRLKETLSSCGFLAGMLSSLLIAVVWFVNALNVESAYILGPLVDSEIDRVSADLSWSSRIKDLAKMPYYFLVRFVPWTPLLIYFYLRFKEQITRDSWLFQALVWVFLVIVFFSFPTFKRDDYLLPAFPVAAVLTGYFIGQISARRFQAGILATAYAAVIFMGVNDVLLKDHLQSRHGDHVKEFAAVINGHVADTAKLAFYDTGYHPLQSYLGRNQAAIKPSPGEFDQADWLVAPVEDTIRPDQSVYRYKRLEKTAESDLILKVGGRHDGRLALFRIVR